MKIKKIKFTLFAPDPEHHLANGRDFDVEIIDDGSIIDVLATMDNAEFERKSKSPFPLYKGLIKSYLQLVWDPQENTIYDDCAVNAYGPNREFMPLKQDAFYDLIPNSELTIVVHAD